MTTSTVERLTLAAQAVEPVALSTTLPCALDLDQHGEPMATAHNFFERLGVHGSIPSLNKTYADYRATRLRLEAAGPPGPSVDAARGIEELLAVCRDVRLTWPAGKVAQWIRLVDSGMAPATAREAVILIHACAGEQIPHTTAGSLGGSLGGVGRGLAQRSRRVFSSCVERLLGP